MSGTTTKPVILRFPEKQLGKHLKIYGDTSYANQIAVLTHWLHNHDTAQYDREEVKQAIRGFIVYKGKGGSDAENEIPNEEIAKVAEAPASYGQLFDDFFHVPFPAPTSPRFTFIDLFAGIGGFRIAMQSLGGKCVYSSEFDPKAQETYLANFGDMPFGDITKEAVKSYIPEKFDVLCGGFPCQAFSIMGKRKGFEDTRGTLFFEIADILKKHKPKAVFLENVKQLVTHDKGRTFEVILSTLAELGYHVKWKILNALDFGVPQKRERVIIVGFRDKEKTRKFNFDFPVRRVDIGQVLEPEERIDISLFASPRIVEKRTQRVAGSDVFYPSIWHENKSGHISVLKYACALRTGASYNYLLINGKRRPSSRELLRIQGFPDKFKIAVSYADIRRQTGNAVAVPMIEAVGRHIIEVL